MPYLGNEPADTFTSIPTVQQFNGDASTTAFTLSSSVASEDNLIVFIEGVFQNKATYAASGTTITFATAPANTRKIVVFHVKTSISGTSMVQDAFTGNGSTTAYTLSALPNNENNTQLVRRKYLST